MKGIVYRIEDGKTAVIAITGGGQMLIPVEQFNFQIYEGIHLNIEFMADIDGEIKLKKEIEDLKKELLKRTEGQDKKD